MPREEKNRPLTLSGVKPKPLMTIEPKLTTEVAQMQNAQMKMR